MIIEIKFYRQYDLDLIGLREIGYPIGDMTKKALMMYANGTPIKYNIAEPNTITFSENKSFRARLNITDEASIALLKGIRSRYRNSFCKMILRDALVHQQLSAFYVSSAFSSYEQKKYSFVDVNAFKNVMALNKKSLKKRRAAYLDNKLSSVTGVENYSKLDDNYIEPQKQSDNTEADDLREMVRMLSQKLDAMESSSGNSVPAPASVLSSTPASTAVPVSIPIPATIPAESKNMVNNVTTKEPEPQNDNFHSLNDSSDDLMEMFENLMGE